MQATDTGLERPQPTDTAHRVAVLNRNDKPFHVVLAQQFDREMIEQLCQLADMIRSIGGLRRALDGAKVGQTEKLAAFRRLDQRVRELEKIATGPSLETIVENEWDKSSELGGMTVFGQASDKVREKVRGKQKKTPSAQLDLFSG